MGKGKRDKPLPSPGGRRRGRALKAGPAHGPATPRGPAEYGYQVFISHSHQDAAWVLEWLVPRLDARFRVCVDARDFRIGRVAVHNMREGVRSSRKVVLVLTPSYVASEWTAFEAVLLQRQDPMNKEERLLPLMLKECEPPDEIAMLTWADFRARSGWEAEFERLAVAIGGPEAAAPAVAVTGAAGTLPPVWNVPHRRNPHFAGRDALLARLRECLTSGEPTALTQTQAIHGLGGVGKTQLAVEYAYRYRDDYEVVWWVRAGDPATRGPDYAALAQGLDLREKDLPDQRGTIEAVRRALEGRRRWLLVFDNAPEPEDLADLLPRAETGHVIITSRYPDWRGLAGDLAVPVMEPDKAVTFLCGRLPSCDEGAAGALAEALGYLPLALEQSAAYMEAGAIGPGEYLRLFRRHAGDLLARGQSSQSYEGRVVTTWSLSMERASAASPAAGPLLDLCAFLGPDAIPPDVVQGGADLLPEPLAAAARDEVRFSDAVAALRRYSLVVAGGGGLSVHRLVQQVVRDRLGPDGVRDWAGRAARLMAAAFPRDGHDVRTWPECARLLPHALAAGQHAEQAGAALEEAGRLLNQAAVYLDGRALYAEAERLFKRALALSQRALGPDHPDVGRTMNNLAALYRAKGRLGEAEPLFTRALAIREKALPPDHRDVATSLNSLGMLYRLQGRFAEAARLYERALAIREKVLGPGHPDVAMTLNNLALLCHVMGRHDEAERLHLRSLAIREAALGPDHPGRAVALVNLGGLYGDRKDYAKAEDHLRQALAIFEKALGEVHPHVAAALERLARTLRATGRADEAADLEARARTVRDELARRENDAKQGA